MNPTHHVVRRNLARRIAIYVMIGVAWTYAITAVVVLLLPIPTMSYGGRATFHRAEFDSSRPFLRLRVWQSPHGSYFQIHRTRPLNAKTLTSYYDVESLTDSQKQAVIENPKLEDASFIPRWSSLRRDWPARLSPNAELLEKGGMWYELRMGWPLPCLRGRYTRPSWRGPDTIEDCHGVIPVRRPAAFWGSGRRFGTVLVGLPLIPDWPAFLASVLLYATLSFAAVTARRSARTWRRRRRGSCIACGYDLRGSTDGCPECGRPMRESERKPMGRANRQRAKTPRA